LRFEKIEFKKNYGWPIYSRYINRLSLHAGYINYILFKAVVVNKLKHEETRSSVSSTYSQ